MDIIYKNIDEEVVTFQQLSALRYYYKAYIDNNVLQKEEFFVKQELNGLKYYNNSSDVHQTIINDNLPANGEYNWLSIIERETVSGTSYILDKVYTYDRLGNYTGRENILSDVNGDEMGYECIDKNGVTLYHLTRKEYWDRSINPDRELFECTFAESTGNLEYLYYNNEHIDEDEHESIFLVNNATDKQTLMNLAGISQDLADYYMVAAVIPTF